LVPKTWRRTEVAQRAAERAGMQADVLDCSLVTLEYGRNIHPWKGYRTAVCESDKSGGSFMQP
jgi:hypothetical protein